MFTQKFHIPPVIAQERPGAPENQKIQYQAAGFQSSCPPGAWRGRRPSVLSGVVALHWFPSKAQGLRRRVAKASNLGTSEQAGPAVGTYLPCWTQLLQVRVEMPSTGRIPLNQSALALSFREGRAWSFK